MDFAIPSSASWGGVINQSIDTCSSNISAVLVIKGMYFPIPLQRSPEKQLLATAHPSPVAGGTCLGVLEHKAFLLPLYFLNCPWCAFNFF